MANAFNAMDASIVMDASNVEELTVNASTVAKYTALIAFPKKDVNAAHAK